MYYNCKENFFMWKVVDITKDFWLVLSVLFSVEVMIRKSLTAPNIRRMEQLLKEEDSYSEPDNTDHTDPSDLSDLSDLSSVSSVSSRRSCTCHCQCKKRRRLNIKKRKTDTNTRRSSFSERSSNSSFHVKTGISTSVSLSLRLGNKINSSDPGLTDCELFSGTR